MILKMDGKEYRPAQLQRAIKALGDLTQARIILGYWPESPKKSAWCAEANKGTSREFYVCGASLWQALCALATQLPGGNAELREGR